MKRTEQTLPRPTWTCMLLLITLVGCGATKNHYLGAAEQQQQRTAEAAANDADSATADTSATYLRLVDRMQRDGLWFASLAHIDALEQRWGASPDSMRMRADALRQTGQANESRKLYEKLMGTSLEAAGYRGLGLLAGGSNDYPQAVHMLEQAQRRTPTDAVLLSDLGYAQMRAGRLAQARVPLMQALQLAAENTQVQANAALYLLASGQVAQAQALMDANKMPVTTRTAIEEAAASMTVTAPTTPAPFASVPAVAEVATTATATASTEARPTLALKTSPWPRRVHVMVRPQVEPTALATARTVDSAEPFTPSPPSGEQP